MDGVLPGVSPADLHGPDAGGIVHVRVLETFHRFSFGEAQVQEFDIHLNVVAWDLLFVSISLYRSPLGIAGKSV